MPTLATPPLLRGDTAAPAMACHAAPPNEAMPASAARPPPAQGMAWLLGLLHRGWEFAWQELPGNLAALGAFLAQQAQSVLLDQAMALCTEWMDWAVPHLSHRLADPQNQTHSLGESLLRTAMETIPGSQPVCRSVVTQLQVQTKTLLAAVQAYGSEDAPPDRPAASASACTLPAPCADSADPEFGGQPPEMHPDAHCDVGLVGDWDTGVSTALL